MSVLRRAASALRFPILGVVLLLTVAGVPALSAPGDLDDDGIPDNVDADDDNDGIPDAEECLESFVTFSTIHVPNHLSLAEIPLLFDGDISHTGNKDLRIHQSDDPGDNVLTMRLSETMPAGTPFTLYVENDDADGDDAQDIVDSLLASGVDHTYWDRDGDGVLEAEDFDVNGDGDTEVRDGDYSPVGVTISFYDGNPGYPAGSGPGTVVHSAYSPVEIMAPVVYPTNVTSPAPFDHIVIESTFDGTGKDPRFVEIEIAGFGNDGTLGFPKGTAIDTDGDGVIDCHDLDSDNDGISDLVESGADPAVVALDTNGDGMISPSESPDGDSDGLIDVFGTGTEPGDDDADGIDDFLDLDSDGDGIPDNVEAQRTIGYVAPAADSTATYAANRGVNSAYLIGLSPRDTDGDGVPDHLDLDSDDDGPDDTTEAGLSLSGNIGLNGLDNAVETGGIDQGWTDPNGIIDVPSALPDDDGDVADDDPPRSDVDYRDDEATAVHDLALAFSTPDEPAQESDVLFTAVVSNLGVTTDPGPVELTVDFSAAYRSLGAGSLGWSCSNNPNRIRCFFLGPVAPGESTPPLQLLTSVIGPKDSDARAHAVAVGALPEPDLTNNEVTLSAPVQGGIPGTGIETSTGLLSGSSLILAGSAMVRWSRRMERTIESSGHW